jgi:hypothetical protein
MMKDREFRSVLASIERRADEHSDTGVAIRFAMKRVPKKTNPAHYWEEVAAYMVEANPKITIVRRIIAIVKRVLLKMGISPDILNQKDITALADIAVRSRANQAKKEVSSGAKEAVEGSGQGKRNGNTRTMVPDRQAVEAGGEFRHSEGRAEKEIRKVTPEDLDSPNFLKWFGKSRAFEEDGSLTIFYHRSPAFGKPSGSYVFGKNKEQQKSPRSGLGHFFTEKIEEAHGYSKGTGNVYAVALRLENPYIIEAWDNPLGIKKCGIDVG